MKWNEAIEHGKSIVFHDSDTETVALLNLEQGEQGQATLAIQGVGDFPATGLAKVSQSIKRYGLDDDKWTI